MVSPYFVKLERQIKELHIQDIPWPPGWEKAVAMGSKPVKCCRINQWMSCMICIEMGLYHLSINHPLRYPTWDEIKAVRYALLPDEKTFALLFPPRAQYVNLAKNCFHLHEVPMLHEQSTLIIP